MRETSSRFCDLKDEIKIGTMGKMDKRNTIVVEKFDSRRLANKA